AMEMLINTIMKLGGDRARLEVKIFGGAKLFESSRNVGGNNIEWAINYIKTEGLNLLKQDTGDLYPRKIYYFTETGRVLMKKIKRLRNSTLIDRETEYAKEVNKKEETPVDDITLF
ncbi:MAG: chemoreceptor glutamine deamidase CheD, partial [Nitrospirota bacterium]|nr:chemoreceptor glutamine deamidase CheD [Nitrospirota bacterium]